MGKGKKGSTFDDMVTEPEPTTAAVAPVEDEELVVDAFGQIDRTMARLRELEKLCAAGGSIGHPEVMELIRLLGGE